MRQILHVILLFIALLIGRYLGATDIIGGSLRYEAISAQQYKIIGVVNRNCGGPALAIPTFKVYSGTTSFTLTATRTSIKDITYYCKSDTPRCQPNNTKGIEGQEQHTFEATINFGNSPYNGFYNSGNCEVIFSMEACCRSAQTTNITANNFYIEAMLNLCVLGTKLSNSNSKTTPVSYMEMCCNVPALRTFNFSDLDDDSLFFETLKPKKSKDSFERYSGLLTAKFPMTPFCYPPGTVNCKALTNAKPPRGIWFDSITGDFILTPINCNERAILNIRTSEYRLINGTVTLIGYSTNEVFIKIRQCSDNNPPSIPTSNKWSVCEGNKLCFTIQSRDTRAITQTADDTTYLSWSKNIPGATFRIIDTTAREKAAEFCWQTKTGDSKQFAYQFTAFVTDSNCQSPLGISKGFIINVKSKAKATRDYKKLSGNLLVFEGKKSDSLTYSYEWQIRDSMGNLPLYKTFKQKDSFKFKDTGHYFITIIVNNLPNNCPTIYVDTVYMNGSVTTSIKSLRVSDILIYPNPTSGFIKLELNNSLHYTGMTITNNIGQVIYTGAVIPVFDMRPFAKGIYTIEIRSTEGVLTRQVIKE